MAQMTLDQLLAWRMRLMNSIASTTTTVEFEDRRMERRSIEELMKSLEWVEGQIGVITGEAPATGGLTRVRVTTTSKDL